MKKRIGLFFWGISNEAEVSIASALNIEKHIDLEKYSLIPIFWSKTWMFYKLDTIKDCINKNETKSQQDILESKQILIEDFKNTIDLAFLITHGKFGEDWILQSLFEMFTIPYCGCRVLSSALCMDKWVFKTFCEWQDIPQLPFEILTHDIETNKKIIKGMLEKYWSPLYVKPANSWSSVGITKIWNLEDFFQAYELAKKHDSKIIVEKWLVSPKEIEVAVLGNDILSISEPWELILQKDFYDFEDKYKKWEATSRIPAKISLDQKEQIKKYAEEVYKLCECKWFARVDFFLSEWRIYLNEINTLPWFTDISMFPMLMNTTGLNYSNLISKIIELGY